MNATVIRLCLAVALTLYPGKAMATGYQLLKVDGIYGSARTGAPEAGVGLSLYSDELRWWLTTGHPSHDGYRVKEWWLSSRWRGPIMGELSPSMVAAGFEEEDDGSRALVPFRFWRLGSSPVTGKRFEWDWSRHMGLNLPGLLGASSRRLIFGPTVGLGLNLTWWNTWKGASDRVMNTGKVTAEVGWLAGFYLGDHLYGQARLTGHYDAFGVHQSSVNLAGVVGLAPGRSKGSPLGIEIWGEADHGNDTHDTLPQTSYAMRLALVWRVHPPEVEPELEQMLDAMKLLLEDMQQARESMVPRSPRGADGTRPPHGQHDEDEQPANDQEDGGEDEPPSDDDQREGEDHRAADTPEGETGEEPGAGDGGDDDGGAPVDDGAPPSAPGEAPPRLGPAGPAP